MTAGAAVAPPRTADAANAMLRRAEAAFAEGRAGEAAALVGAVLTIAPDNVALLQFHAVLLRAAGDPAAAHRAILTAARHGPRDPRVANTLGCVLGDLGRNEEALAAHERALALDPGFFDAALNVGLTLKTLGRPQAAALALARLDDPRAYAARADIASAAGDLAGAAELLDRAGDEGARARLAVERNEPGAGDRLRAAVAAAPDDAVLVLAALDWLGEDADAARAERLLARRPDWHDGRRALALRRRERGDRAGWLAGYDAAIRARPRDVALHRERINLLSGAADFAGAARACHDAAAATGAVAFRASAAGFHDAAGDRASARALLDDPVVGPLVPAIVRAKHDLATGAADRAEAALAAICAERPDDIEVWAIRGIAWQVMGDDRAAWLNGQPGMVVPLDLDLDAGEQAGITDYLRTLHGASAERLGHSVRGGGQTFGNLLDFVQPQVVRLRAALAEAVERYRTGLPPADPAHPLLRHRDVPWRFTTSWSVLLPPGGAHVSHIHPRGIVSSASYWATMADEEGQAGWLEFGRPPAYLGIDLPPVMAIRPRVGTLALFPSTLHHGTRPFTTGERMTAAFDVAPA